MENTNFQPMPKRFMVWDDEAIDWICVPGTERHIWDLVDLLTHKTGLMRHKFHMKIVQSTNLFDKDSKEIFEGHIVRVGGETGTVQMMRGEWHAVGDDDIPLSVWKSSGIEILGHILSSPELLEESNA